MKDRGLTDLRITQKEKKIARKSVVTLILNNYLFVYSLGEKVHVYFIFLIEKKYIPSD